MDTRVLQLLPSDGWKALFVSRGERDEVELCRKPFPAFCLVEVLGEAGGTFLSGVLPDGSLVPDDPLFVAFVARDEPLEEYDEEAEKILRRAEKGAT